MSEPIKVGDLVQVVKVNHCCGSDVNLGHIFVADHIQGGPNRCASCGRRFANSVDVWSTGSDWSAEITRLKRIPPMSQLEHYRSEELLRRDVKEPA